MLFHNKKFRKRQVKDHLEISTTRQTVGIRPHQKSLKRFKDKVREITSSKQANPVNEILKRLRIYVTGWLGYYYPIADMKTQIKTLNSWMRRRIRQIFWKQWREISAKFSTLQKLGIVKGKAWEWANSRKGYWRVAGSYILDRTLTNKYLASIGYEDISQRYEALHSNY